MNQVVGFSGGKDSTAMVLEMLDRGEDIHSCVMLDTGWEFPEMLDHVAWFQRYTGLDVVTLKPEKSFDYWMFEHPIVARKGPSKGQVRRMGGGWPSAMRRWCTREKVEAIRKHLKTIEDPLSCVGYAADEAWRVGKVSGSDIPHRFPLIEWGIDEAKALQICKSHGFDWGGLYDYFPQVSCFCCPLQPLDALRTLRKHFPVCWAQMLDRDARQPEHCPGFKDDWSVHDLDDRFAMEDLMGEHFKIRIYNRGRKSRIDNAVNTAYKRI